MFSFLRFLLLAGSVQHLAAQTTLPAPALHLWPFPIDVFSPVYLPLSALGPFTAPLRVRVTPVAGGRALLDRKLPAATPGLDFPVLNFPSGAYLVEVRSGHRRWTTRMQRP